VFCNPYSSFLKPARSVRELQIMIEIEAFDNA
jgi:hypothetical protein